MAKEKKSKTKSVVKYSNELFDRDYPKMTVVESRFWLAAIATVAERGQTDITMSFEEFSELVGLPAGRGGEYLSKTFVEMAKKVQAATVFVKEVGSTREVQWFFRRCLVDTKTKQITLQTNEEYLDSVNNFMGNFTRFGLKKYLELDTRPKQELFRLIQQGKYRGEVYVSIEELKKQLGMTGGVDKEFTCKVVKKAVEFFKENDSFGEEFEFEKVYSGRKVVGYLFKFPNQGKQEWEYLPTLDELDEEPF